MNDLEQARKEINEIDKEMALLFERRMAAAERIAAHKKANGLSVKDEARERALIEKNCSYISSAAIEPYYARFLRNVIDISCDYQDKLMTGMRVTYSGTLGAYAHIAAKRLFPAAELSAFADFADAYAAVEKGSYDCAVLPLENSYAGEVGTVMDLIFSGDLHINQVIDVPIVHHLIACPGATKDTVKTVLSHPQALDQCADYIRAHGLETKVFSNTALAAEYVKNAGDPTIAAIASEETASIFGLQILESAINDSKINVTRFASFSKERNIPAPTDRKESENFILVFTVQNKAGSLANALNIVGAHGFNMRNLRSRPMKDLEWSYYFYIEAEGNIHTENGEDMLCELSAICAKLKLVGSYYVETIK